MSETRTAQRKCIAAVYAPSLYSYTLNLTYFTKLEIYICEKWMAKGFRITRNSRILGSQNKPWPQDLRATFSSLNVALLSFLLFLLCDLHYYLNFILCLLSFSISLTIRLHSVILKTDYFKIFHLTFSLKMFFVP